MRRAERGVRRAERGHPFFEAGKRRARGEQKEDIHFLRQPLAPRSDTSCMTRPRSEQINETTTRYYHCTVRCVRRAFLCGQDRYTGKSFDHRREWIVTRLKLLGSVFAIDVLAYAVMANHLHLVLALRSERAASWSDDEVVERFGQLFPMAKANYERLGPKEKSAKVALWRERLSSISWMMRSLNEWVARKANKEDECKGRFWEGRFKSQPLLDEGGLLTCMAYVDLNPVRAGECSRLVDAEWTSIGERLAAAAAHLQGEPNSVPVPDGLVPFADQVFANASTPSDEQSDRPQTIPMNFADYVELLEWTGRCRRKRGPAGTLEGAPPAILARLRIRPDAWLGAMTQHGLHTRGALGRVEALCAHAAAQGRQRVAGKSLANALFQ